MCFVVHLTTHSLNLAPHEYPRVFTWYCRAPELPGLSMEEEDDIFVTLPTEELPKLLLEGILEDRERNGY